MSSVQDKIKVIPIEQPFLKVLAEYVKEKFESHTPDFSNLLMVFPSQRNKFYFRRYLLEVARKDCIIPPAMKTMDELIEYIYESLGGKRGRLLNSIERNFLLKKVIDDLKIDLWMDLPFLKFISVGNRLLNFFDELARERVTLDDIEKETEIGHYPEKYVQNELPILKRIHREYRRVLEESGFADAGDQNERVYGEFSPECLAEYAHIVVAGIAAPTNVETKLIEHILSQLPSEMILHSCGTDDLKGMDRADRPFYIHYKLLKALGVDISRISTLNEKTATEPVVHVAKVGTEYEQTFYLESVLKELVPRYQQLHRIGIVLTEESILYSVTESLKAAGIEFNRSAGLPLAQSTLFSFLGQLYEVISENFHYQTFFTFIRHPLLKNAVINDHALRPLIYGIERSMVAHRMNYYKSEAFIDGQFKPLIELLKRGIDAARADLDLPAYIDSMVSYLNELLSCNEDFIKTNSPDINEFFKQLHDIASLRVAGWRKEGGTGMLEFILRMLRDHRYRVAGDPMRGVQVIGLLEARNLDFDCLILPSMNEGIFPRRSEKDMFINQSVRRAVHLPYDQERDNLYYYYFTELIKGKKEVYISYVAEEDRDVASRFISLTMPGMGHEEPNAELLRSTITIPKREVKKNPDVVKRLRRNFQERGLSPSALSEYRKCPYRYYLGYVLGLREPDSITEEPGAKEWGEVVHDAISHFYRDHFPGGFTPDDTTRARSVMEQELKKALAKNKSLAVEPKAITYLDLNLYLRRLSRFLENETVRFQTGFKPVLEEEKRSYTVPADGLEVVIRGRIDRIDSLNEKYYIIDYKTGKLPAEKNRELGPGFTEFQLPLYALMFSGEQPEKIGGMMYYEIGTKCRTVDVGKDTDVHTYLAAFRQDILLPTIIEILNPEIPFNQTSDEESCRFCAYGQLCGGSHGAED